ncbi:MAG: 4Fe-4S dicluster domain-containing protein [Chitinivibrionales bacterium]|nr:4Fe-4S dicluster domain-containing protein [Chitinivibrionales bacterium]MBD3357054.1 4Fe-4S dicluster domain-containing protein [Chitinivibrionales bacterium]
MKEIVVISGKGGTGKTSIAASFASLAGGTAVLADCDVDAADLHLILKPHIKQRTEFRSGHRAVIVNSKCTGCGTCENLCRFDAVRRAENGTYSIDPVACEGCGVCVRFCPADAVDFPEETCGEWFVSDTRFGTMVHARLGVAAENSGKLVTLVRNEANKTALKQGADFIVVDGSPGIGCPVIASLTAADAALIVTEPTVSGEHDLGRIAELTKRLNIPTMVCVNKWDINRSAADRIVEFAESHGIKTAGRIRYDKAVTEAQRHEKAIPEYSEGGISEDIVSIWEFITARSGCDK